MNFDRKKSFRLFVETDSDEGPEDRWYRSLRAALRGYEALDEEWKRDAWIIEYREEPRFGGIPVVRNIVHMRYGRLTDEDEEETS